MLVAWAAAAPAQAADSHAGASPAIIVDLTAAGQLQAFRPDETFGAGIDGAEEGDIDRLFTPHNIAAMKSAGLRPLTYRLRTELGIEAWHWNPVGHWSDPAHKQGYWTSSDQLGKPISLSWGYRLPRRGDTIDNANNDDYSRLTDGDRRTFWKSNPYLDPSVVRDGLPHSQWLMLRFDRPRPIDAAVIDWAEPYATQFEVQYWSGEDDADPAGRWIAFPHGTVTDGRGGQPLLNLADKPIVTRYVRVVMRKGSGVAAAGAVDWRDRMGFAVREVSFGTKRADGSLADIVVHAARHDGQTFAHVSSTDPWHRASDRDANLEQVGIDRIFASGLTSNLPMMLPTGLLYDTPENIAAELRYVARRHYPVTRVELGEEPDGQYAEAADYGALYVAAVDRLRSILPSARFGGPSLQSAFTDTWMLPETPGSWNRWFIAYLKQRKRLDDLGFLSFEFYPFDNICGDLHRKLIAQTHMMDAIATRLDRDGVPRDVPRLISEYGFSAFSGRAMSEMPSALLMADINGEWLKLGGAAAYMFGYGPNVPTNQHQRCAGFGNMMLFMADDEGQAAQPMPSLRTARLLTQVWTLPGHRLHRMMATAVSGMTNENVKAYAVRRPDGRLAVLAINRSARHTYRLPLKVKQDSGRIAPLSAPAESYSYGPAQYSWLDAGPKSHPLRNEPPAHRTVPRGAIEIALPPETISVTVVTLPELAISGGVAPAR